MDAGRLVVCDEAGLGKKKKKKNGEKHMCSRSKNRQEEEEKEEVGMKEGWRWWCASQSINRLASCTEC